MLRYLIAVSVLSITCCAHAQFPDPPCLVSPFSAAPAFIQGPLTGDLTGVVHIGRNEYGDHFVSGNIDGAFWTPGKIVTSACSHLLPGANLDSVRKGLEVRHVLNASHASWVWMSLMFDQKTGQEIIITKMILDDHGRVLAAGGSLTPGLAHYAVLEPGTKLYHADIYQFFKHYEHDQAEHLALIRNGQ